MSFLTSLNSVIALPHLYRKPSSEFGSSMPRPCFLVRNTHQFECSNPLFPPANQSVAAIVFGDGSSQSKLYPLTKRRSEAAITIGGNYRLIDSVVSNCINSDITKIYALTQFNSTSLNSHLSRAYSGARLLRDGFVEVIAAYQSPEDNGWFQGTADAIRRCLWVLEEHNVLEFLILPGHHLYKMDYQKLIESHRRSKADITVSVFCGTRDVEDLGFGIFRLNAENQVMGFRENQEINDLNMKTDDDGDDYPCMGIYAINRHTMIKLLKEYLPNANDLKNEVIPCAMSLGMKIHAYRFNGYWEDMRSIKAYYKANMEIVHRSNKAYKDNPMYTLPRHLPPTFITDAFIADSVIADGCILSVRTDDESEHCLIKCRIKGSVVGMRTKIGDDAVIEDSVILGSDAYNHTSNNEGKITEIPVGIGKGSHIRKAIIDKNARIGQNVKIMNIDKVEECVMEANGYIISGGIIVVIRSAVISDETII